MLKGFFTSVYRFMYFHIAGGNEVFSPVWILPWFLTVVIVLESLVTIHTTKGFLTSMIRFVYFHIAGRNEGFFSHVASATWELKVVILLKSLVTMHATKGFFTSVDSFVYFHIAGKNEGFSPVWLLPWLLRSSSS